jgi:hypothetical protein
MADFAVRRELLSSGQIPLLNRKYRDFGHPGAACGRKPLHSSEVSVRIPYSTEQGNLEIEQGMLKGYQGI